MGLGDARATVGVPQACPQSITRWDVLCGSNRLTHADWIFQSKDMERAWVALGVGWLVLLVLGATAAVILLGRRTSPPEVGSSFTTGMTTMDSERVTEESVIEEGVRMLAERLRCEPQRLASQGQPLWARLQGLAGCAHRQERKIDALESELSRFREADALERAYWRHLSEAGLTRRVEHVPR